MCVCYSFIYPYDWLIDYFFLPSDEREGQHICEEVIACLQDAIGLHELVWNR